MRSCPVGLLCFYNLIALCLTLNLLAIGLPGNNPNFMDLYFSSLTDKGPGNENCDDEDDCIDGSGSGESPVDHRIDDSNNGYDPPTTDKNNNKPDGGEDNIYLECFKGYFYGVNGSIMINCIFSSLQTNRMISILITANLAAKTVSYNPNLKTKYRTEICTHFYPVPKIGRCPHTLTTTL